MWILPNQIHSGFSEAKRRWNNSGLTNDEASQHAIVDCQSISSRIFTGHEYKVMCVAVDEEHQILYSAANEETTGSVHQWSVATGALIRKFEPFQDVITVLVACDEAVFCALGGREMVAVRLSGQTSFISGKGGRKTHSYSGHSGGLTALTIHGNHKWLFSGSTDNAVIQYHASTGNRIRTFMGHTAAVRAIAHEGCSQTHTLR